MAKKREAVSAMQDRGWWSQDELARQTKLSQPAISKLSLFCGFFGGFFVFFYPFRGFFGVFLGASLASSLFLATSEASLASSDASSPFFDASSGSGGAPRRGLGLVLSLVPPHPAEGSSYGYAYEHDPKRTTKHGKEPKRSGLMRPRNRVG